MPSLPDIPGKSLITGMTKRTRTVVATAGAGALAVGGFVAKRLLAHRGGDDKSAAADPIAETPTAPPGAEEKPVPKPKPAKPKPAKPDAASKPKPPKPKTAPKAKAEKPPKPEADQPPKTTDTDAPPKPEAEPGNQTGGKDPHHALNNPVVDDPDPTEYPDPYDTREDPLDEPHPPSGAESTSEPPLQRDPEVESGGKPPRRENLDD
jgi:hypothetical protein